MKVNKVFAMLEEIGPVIMATDMVLEFVNNDRITIYNICQWYS